VNADEGKEKKKKTYTAVLQLVAMAKFADRLTVLTSVRRAPAPHTPPPPR